MIKLIAIDLDGTLLNQAKEISFANKAALHYAQKRGVKVVLCTGRPYLAMQHLFAEIALVPQDEYVILFNGSQIRRVEDGQVIYEESLSHSDLELWLSFTEAENLPLTVFDSEWVYDNTAYQGRQASTYQTPAPRKRIDYQELSQDQRFNKFVICTTPDNIANYYDKISDFANNRYQMVLSHPYQIEISPMNINKGSALQYLSDYLNIEPSEVMAIGDEYNDASMLSFAGVSVAMDNAVDDMKALADFVTFDNNHSGVAHAIYHYLT